MLWGKGWGCFGLWLGDLGENRVVGMKGKSEADKGRPGDSDKGFVLDGLGV